MMKKYTTPIIIGILFGISALIYAVQFFVFHDSKNMEILRVMQAGKSTRPHGR